MTSKHVFGTLVLALTATLRAEAAPILLDFEGLDDLESVAAFYDGGPSGNGHIGPDYGVQFSALSQAIIDMDAGGSGNTANEPSGETVLFFGLGSVAATMNVAPGFHTSLSFYYAAENTPGIVNIYDGLDGTGNLLASLALPVTGPSCGGDPMGVYNCWSLVTVPFAGVARSADLSGTRDHIVFDNVAFDTVPVPEPTVALLVALGVAAAAGRRRRAR